MNHLIHAYLEHHAGISPERPAYICQQQQINYAELNSQSNQLAHALVTEGAEVGDRIGIYMDKSLHIACSLYGILKAGAAYVPLDPTAPPARLAQIIVDCGINILISADNKVKHIQQVIELLDSQHQQAGLLQTVVGVSVEDDSFRSLSWVTVFASNANTPCSRKVIESDLAYVIYTSGSTGKPKGIMHTHHSCLSYARWAAEEYQLKPTDRLGNHSPLHFDISIFDLFAGVVAGATTVIIPEEVTKFPASLTQLIIESQMTVLFTVPFALIQLLLRGVLEENPVPSLRWIIFGGDPFPIKHLRKLKQTLPQTTFDNMYGPAEINGCTHFTVNEISANTQSIPIGPMNAISLALVVNEQDHEVAATQVGELLVRTPTMMQGYWGRPDLNARAYLDLQAAPNLSHRYYRTGDLVTRDPDGTLWFVGRKDRQVKVRGYRVELDEIEAILVSHEQIQEAAVFTGRNEENQLEIRAAYIAKDTNVLALKGLSKYLKNQLPGYAVPTQITAMDSFPRTTSGKIDRKSLAQEQSLNA